MYRSFAPLTAVAALMAGTAHADVTAADVWQNYNAIFGAFGGSIAVDTSTDGATTRYDNHTIDFTLPLGAGSVTVELPPIALTENGDGTVAMSYPAGFPIRATVDITGEGSVVVAMDGTVGDSVIEVSGVPGEVSYLSGDSAMAFELTDVVIDGRPFTDATFTVAIDSIGAASDMVVTETDGAVTVAVDSQVETMTLAYDYHVLGYESGYARNIITGSTSGFDLTIPAGGIDVLNIAPALRAGLAFALRSASANSSSTTVTKDTLGVITSEQSTYQEATDVTMAFDADGLSFAGTGDALELSLREALLPMPVNLTLESVGIDWAIPLLASPEAQELRLDTRLNGLTLAPQLWDMIDPGAVLDRAPLTFDIGVRADTVLNVDLVDIAALDQLDRTGDLPGTVPSVTLDNLLIEALGAQVTADGEMSLDFEAMQFLGAPIPAGTLNFTATGVNAAIAALTQAGLTSPQETMGITFMLGMIGRPTGDDAYEGSLEMTEDGQFLANGVPLQ